LNWGAEKRVYIKAGLCQSRQEIYSIDIKDEVLIRAKEKIESEYAAANANTGNIKLMSHEIMIIYKMMNEHDVVNGFISISAIRGAETP
jgi:hypothetical protein